MSRAVKLIHYAWYKFKLLLAHTFSTSGLCAMVASYSLLGAVIFVRLESANERLRHEEQQKRLREMLKQVASDLWINTLYSNVLYQERWINETEIRLEKYQKKLYEAFQMEPFMNAPSQWSFSGALLYSITVITTIGYGNVTCRTSMGRIATILYAILGIPLTFLCLTNLGTLMANMFRFIYRKVLCCKTSSSTKIQVPILLVFTLVFVYIGLGAYLFSIWENWGIIEGAYFCFTTLTTIGFGDFVPGTARFDDVEWNSGEGHYKFIACSGYMLFGLAMIAMCFNLVQEEAVDRCRQIALRIGLLKT